MLRVMLVRYKTGGTMFSVRVAFNVHYEFDYAVVSYDA